MPEAGWGPFVRAPRQVSGLSAAWSRLTAPGVVPPGRAAQVASYILKAKLRPHWPKTEVTTGWRQFIGALTGNDSLILVFELLLNEISPVSSQLVMEYLKGDVTLSGIIDAL